MDKNLKLTYSPKELKELFKKNNLPPDFCIVPFSNLILNPSGDVGICRQKGTEHIVGNILNESISNIWNNEYLKQWRNEFLTGDINICKKEIATDACHLSPDNYVFFPEIDLNQAQGEMPLKLTANFNGKCNLKCTMCDVWMMKNGLYDRIGFWEKAQYEFFPYIKEIEMLSGEPFIQKDTYRLIDLISEVNSNVLWSITTNGFWRFNKAIEKSLDKINIKNIIFSIDSLNEDLYSEIRVGGNLSLVLKTVNDLRSYEKKRAKLNKNNLGLTLHFLVMKKNWKELPDIVDFTQEKDMKLTINNCYDPKTLSLCDYETQKELDIGLEIIDMCDPFQLRCIVRCLLSIAHDLPKFEKAVLLESLFRKINKSKGSLLQR